MRTPTLFLSFAMLLSAIAAGKRVPGMPKAANKLQTKKRH